MRIAGMADQHGALSSNAPECDVLAIVGDFMPLLSTAENWKQWQEYDWAKTKYVRWLRRQPARRILIVYGNHDIAGCAPDTRAKLREKLEADGRVTVLDDRCPSVEFEGARFTGHSYTPTIQQRSWAFSQARSSHAVKLATDAIHPDTDILLTHGPPQGLLDTCSNGDRAGCAALMHRMLEIGPVLTLCGHIHEERGKRLRYYDLRGRERRIGNVSIMDREYSAKGGRAQVFDI
jgi:Icc-related predicted phosphoesterase